MQDTQDVVSRLSELSVKANSGILSRQDRQVLQAEQHLTAHLEDNMNSAEFNGKKIFDDSEFTDMVKSFENIDLTTSTGISDAATAASDAIDMLSQRQATLSRTKYSPPAISRQYGRRSQSHGCW